MSRVYALIGGILGGIWVGSLVGIAEMAWLWRDGVDASVLPWAWGLYGLAGLGPGLVFGGGIALLAKLGPRVRAMAFPGGAALAGVALAAIVGRYVLNRDVFSESMPLWATAALVLGALVLGAIGVGVVRPKLESRALAALGGVWLTGLVIAVAIGWIGTVQLDTRGWGPSETAAPPSELLDKPDVLFIMVDTFRADHLDHPDVDTPHLDRLRADSVTFEQAFSASSWTRPGVASMWSSRLPTSHTADTKGSRLPEEVVTWSEVLRSSGVRTGAFVNNINVTASFGFDQGYDTFVYEAPAYPFGATEGVFGLALYKVLHRVEERVSGGGPVERYYQPADVVLGHADTWMQAQGAARWALFVHLMEPHDPYFDEAGRGYARATNQHPDPSEEADLRAMYADEVERLDAHLGRFFDTLREQERYDDLLIVLTSDHGEEFYEHGGWWHGNALYGEQTQVPLVVKLPGNRFGGARPGWSVRTLDVPPTLSARLGLPAHADWEGKDLFDEDVMAHLISMEAPEAVPEEEEPSDVEAGDAVEAPDEAPAVDPATLCMQERRDALDRIIVMELDFEGNEVAGVRGSGLSWYKAEPGGTRELPPQALFDTVADPTEQADLLAQGASVCSRFAEDWAADQALALEAARAAGGDIQGADVQTSAADRQRLCALGYLTGPECSP